MASAETWRAVPGYEGAYEVSDLGAVRSLDRYVDRGGAACRIKGQLKRPGAKYNSDQMMLSHNDVRRCVSVGKLVAMAFLGAPPDCAVVHLDDNPRNNRATNLRVATHAEAGKLGKQKATVAPRRQIVSTDTAEYRTIPGCPQYEISQTGKVRSKPQQLRGCCGSVRRRPAIELRQQHRGGVLMVRMRAGEVYVTRSIAALLAAVWGD